jgi:OOP family OmpA-OmpF porin
MKYLLCSLITCLAFFACYAQGYRLEGMELKPDGNIVFESGTANIKPESEAALRNVKKYLDDKTYITLLRVEGHVDGSGQDQTLSEARANAIATWLVNAGVDCMRLTPVGFGNTKPVSEIKAANNRIAFANAALKGRPIGGMPVDGGGKVAGDPCK